MCILCVASKWSRRVVTMLPWLIIPLIILWALSQLLPPGFRFEVTSPRLACVAVLLVSLGWYELVMPMLSSWRARRSVLLWERRRIELQEAAKWRKEALRCCRNCLTPYRDQTPSGGRFMCTYCGHVSKRPVLDITGRAPGSMGPGMARIRVTGGGNLPGAISASGLVTGGMFCGKWNSRIWSGRGLPNKAGKAGGRGWRAGRSSMIEAGGWGVNGPWFGSSGAGGKGCSVVGVGGWGGMGDSFPCGMFGGGRCTEAESNSVVLLFLFRLFSYAAFWLGWIWRKLPRLVRTGEDNLNGGRRPGQSKVEDGSTLHGSRVDKARRKAEEKRQAKLEKELLEAEERKQREEVARLVEERRRQRDEKLEAEIENEKDAATKREKEVRKEREAERRQHNKAREREKGFSKDEPKEQEAKQNKGKDNEKRNDTELNERKKAKKSMLNEVERHKSEKLFGGPRQEETGFKSIESQLKSVTGNMSKSGSSRYLGSLKSSLFLHSKNTGYFSNSSRSFLGRRLSTSSNFGVKFGNVATRTTPTASSSSVLHAGSTGRVTEASGSSSNKTPWTKVWGNGSVSEDSSRAQVALVDGSNGRSDLNVQCEMKHLLNGSPVRSFSPPTVGVPQPPIAPPSSQTKSFDHIFSSPLVFPPIELPVNMRNEQDHEQAEVGSKKPCSPLTPCHILFGTSAFPPPQSSETSYEQTPLLLSELRSRASISHPSLLVPSGLDSTEEIGGVEMNDPLSLLGSVSDALLTSFPSNLGMNTSPSMKSNSLLPIIQTAVPEPTCLSPPMESPVLKPLRTSGVNQVPQMLEPWCLPPLSSDDSKESSDKGKWQIWDAPQLDHIKVPKPSPWLVPPYDVLLEQDKHVLQPFSQSRPQSALEPETHLPSCLFSPKKEQGSPKQSNVQSFGTAPLLNSNSIWTEFPSAFGTIMQNWDDLDIHHDVPPEFVDCITQELMEDPVITADGHSYERSAIETWLKSHDTSPKTGEVLPPPPGGNGTGVDKTLRPNHILRGQIIEYKERVTRMAGLQEGVKGNSWSAVAAKGSTSTLSTTSSTRPRIGRFYTLPGVQSVWSYDLS